MNSFERTMLLLGAAGMLWWALNRPPPPPPGLCNHTYVHPDCWLPAAFCPTLTLAGVCSPGERPPPCHALRIDPDCHTLPLLSCDHTVEVACDSPLPSCDAVHSVPCMETYGVHRGVYDEGIKPTQWTVHGSEQGWINP